VSFKDKIVTDLQVLKRTILQMRWLTLVMSSQ